MSNHTNTQISMNVAIAVLQIHTTYSRGHPRIYGHYRELAESLIQHLGPIAVRWARKVLSEFSL